MASNSIKEHAIIYHTVILAQSSSEIVLRCQKKKEVQYLGCYLNEQGDPTREVSKQISDYMVVLNTLHVFFYTSNNSITRKIQIYNAIIRSSFMHGLETVVVNTAVFNRLDTFQLKGLRALLKQQTTYINRTYSNDYVGTLINQKLKDARSKELLPLTEWHKL